jgi:hypothetical protein
MTVIDKLASSLHRRDEAPNQELAKQIAAQGDKNAVKELIEQLHHNNKAIASDGIKALYEIAGRKPSLAADHAKVFIALLDSKNNRLQWGTMTVLDAITLDSPETVYPALTKIIETADKGSVITKDHAVAILIKLCSIERYADAIFPLFIAQLLKSPPNQLPMYAEKAIPVINAKNKALFIKTLTARLNDMEKETKRKRVARVMEKVSKK